MKDTRDTKDAKGTTDAKCTTDAKDIKDAKNSIILIGMPGVGKSTVGVVLAKMLGMDFLDTDILIERASHKTLPRLIDEFGYNGLIEIEDGVGAELKVSETVVATGGSMVLSPNAMENLSAQGVVIWLDTDVSKLIDRIGGDIAKRGIAAPNGCSVKEIYDERLPYYKKYARLSIMCDGDIEDTVFKIIAEIYKNSDIAVTS